MNNRDGDFRYMAISDFMTEIQKDYFKLDAESEKKIVNKLLEMVAKDGNADVKALAVKCLGPLATHAQETQLQNMIDKLGNYLLNDNMEDEIRDISSIGLKTVIAEVPETQTDTVNLIISRLSPRLVEVIGKDSKPEVVILCLDVMIDLLSRWGKEMGKQKLYEKIQRAVLPRLQDAQSASRKKAIGCLSYLSVSIPDNLFAELTEFLIKNIESSKKQDHILTYIQAIASVSRAVGFRFGKHLDRIVPILIKHCNQENTNDELRENCLQAFESIVLRCPKESDQFLVKIENLCLKYISYDPNIVEDSEGEGEEQDDMDMDDGENEYGDSDYDFTDDDDMSWKVRKSSTRCITAIIRTRPERLGHLFETVAPTLVKRFKEREENVKLDVFSAYVELLRQTAHVGGIDRELGAGQETGITSKLRAHIPSIVKALVKELKGKSLKTRPGVFQLLVELVTVLPGILSEHIKEFLPGIENALGEKNTSSALKIEALLFLRALLQYHKPQVFIPHLKSITPPVFNAIKDRYYKITAEGLRVGCQLTKVLAHDPADSPHVEELFNSTYDRLKQLDIDQEVKEVAIECTGLIISQLGNLLQKHVADCLKILVDRLSNEVTRLVTVKTFESIAGSHLNIDLEPVLGDVLKHLTSFLRQHNRQLKQATLTCLTVIINNYGKSKVAQPLYHPLLKELSEIISEVDLHLSHLSLTVCATILNSCNSAAETVKATVLPKCHTLLKSALLQGSVLDSVLLLFKEMLNSKSKDLSYDALLSGLIALGSAEHLPKQSYHSIAQCIATLVANNDAKDATVSKFVEDTVKGKTDSVKLLSLYCIGEIGRRVDLSANASVKKNILASLDSNSEEIKSAASVALGCIACGNLTKYLPDILSEISANPKRQYLLLGSLREFIVRLSQTPEGISIMVAFSDKLLALLLSHTTTEEEGTRNVVSECLGKLALIESEKVIKTLQNESRSKDKNTRACVTTAVKSAITEKPNPPLDHLLSQNISSFLDLLADEEIVVRKASLLTMNYCAHHKPQIIREPLGKYLPALYGETVVKPNLIHEVDVGPFKHKTDLGTDLRQAGFETMYTLLDTCLSRLDLVEFIRHITSGLTDTHDIQMLNHLILMRLSKKAGAALVASLDGLVEPLKAAVTSKPKDQAVQQQVERNEELIRSALRAVLAIAKIPEVENSHNFQEFMRTTVMQAPVKEKYEALLREQQLDR